MARPNQPSDFLSVDKLDLTEPSVAVVYGNGYAPGFILHLFAKTSKKHWKGILTSTSSNRSLWRVHLVFTGQDGDMLEGTEDVQVTIINPDTTTTSGSVNGGESSPLDIVGVVIP